MSRKGNRKKENRKSRMQEIAEDSTRERSLRYLRRQLVAGNKRDKKTGQITILTEKDLERVERWIEVIARRR